MKIETIKCDRCSKKIGSLYLTKQILLALNDSKEAKGVDMCYECYDGLLAYLFTRTTMDIVSRPVTIDDDDFFDRVVNKPGSVVSGIPQEEEFRIASEVFDSTTGKDIPDENTDDNT